MLPFTGRMRTPREQLEATELPGVHVVRIGNAWGLRQYVNGRIVDMGGLSRDELADLVDTIARALQSIPL